MDDTILFVDDVPMMLEMEVDFFKDTTVNIRTAKHGLEALKIIKEQKVSLVFLDLEMPVMDGATCCKLIKSDANYRGLPIAMVTWDKQKDLCIASGCDYFLGKPARREQFLDISRKIIPQINRRRKRIPCKCSVTLYRKSQRTDCFLYDISVGGAFIATDCLTQVKELVEVLFALPDGSQIRCFGEVVWITEKNSTHPDGIGIKFLALPRTAEATIINFIENCS